MVVAPILPLFREDRYGKIDNNNGYGVEPRLPLWLSWFDTSYDNSLYGDSSWKTKHCPDHWDDYLGYVLWLWRNPAAGFCWQVLAHPISINESFTYTHSGSGLDIDKGKGKYGWYLIKSSEGAFSLRWCKQISETKVLSFEAGWLLDIYIKDASNKLRAPMATFQFQPQLKSI